MWNLYENEQSLEPMVFSNGKSQEDVIKEVYDSIKQGHKIIFIKGQCGTGKCLDKDTLIFCKLKGQKYFGHFKISELKEKKGKIITLNKSGNLVESNFKNVRKTGIKKLYKLKTRTGREIIASKNHPLLTINKKGVSWKPLEKLNKKSYICLPNKVNLQNKFNHNLDEIKILAHLIAEGKLGDKAGSPIYFQSPDKNLEVRRDYIMSIKNLFPDGEIKSYFKQDIVVNFNKMDTRFGTTNKLRLLIRKYGLDKKHSKQKFIPSFIFNLDNKSIAIFLNRLFSCDGTIYSKNNRIKNQVVIGYTSISKRLIKDVSMLLLRFGVNHTITSKKFKKNQEYAFRISISNHNSLKNFIENIGFIGRKQRLAKQLLEQCNPHKFTNIDKIPRITREYLKSKGHNYLELDRFLNYNEIEKLRKEKSYKKTLLNKNIITPRVFIQGKIDFLRSHLKKINNYLRDPEISFICNESIIWDKVNKIEYLKEDETYDMEVEQHHNFIANGIITHNSAIALNLARLFGKTSIVVPIKSLQEQYTKDYSKNKYVMHNGRKLKIKSIFGRKNFQCKFLQEQNIDIKPKTKEKNATLNNIFEPKNDFKPSNDKSCDNPYLPCKIELKEKNLPLIRKYINENPDVHLTNFSNINEIKRMSIAPICPYWSPLFPKEFEIKKFEDANKIYYTGLENKKYTIYQRKSGCPYYDQYLAYSNSDVLIFNSLKYKLETLMNRKPATELEIIDECDEFLDSFSNEERLNINKLLFHLGTIFPTNESSQKTINELTDIAKTIKLKKHNSEIHSVNETLIQELLEKVLENNNLLDEIEADDSNYIFTLDKIARTFIDFFEETYFSVEQNEKDITIHLVTTNLAKRLKDLTDKNKVLVMMSGTIHSESVLKNIFGLENFKIVEAETQHQGQLIPCKHGYEMNCKYQNFKSKKITREKYLLALSKTIQCSKRPTLVHVNSFADLPTEFEKENFELSLPTQQELIQEQRKDVFGQRIKDFRDKKTNLLFTTKCNRGVDFPGEICNSIVITKYPYPNISSLFWKILKKDKPNYFMSFYMDKAKRELLQKIYRGLRSKSDKIYLLSPDIRVLTDRIN